MWASSCPGLAQERQEVKKRGRLTNLEKRDSACQRFLSLSQEAKMLRRYCIPERDPVQIAMLSYGVSLVDTKRGLAMPKH